MPVDATSDLPATAPSEPAALPLGALDTRSLEVLAGYNIRRASLTIMELFVERMQVFDLNVASFSVLSLIAHNPGVTSRQLCSALSIQPPNLVGIVNALDARGVLERQPHPTDGRAVGLHLTVAGHQLAAAAEAQAEALELQATAQLTVHERKTLNRLLQKIYR